MVIKVRRVVLFRSRYWRKGQRRRLIRWLHLHAHIKVFIENDYLFWLYHLISQIRKMLSLNCKNLKAMFSLSFFSLLLLVGYSVHTWLSWYWSELVFSMCSLSPRLSSFVAVGIYRGRWSEWYRKELSKCKRSGMHCGDSFFFVLFAFICLVLN